MRANEATYFATDRSNLVLKLIDAFTDLVRRYLKYRQRQADLAMLRAMDERDLKDIGLCRGDIDHIAL